ARSNEPALRVDAQRRPRRAPDDSEDPSMPHPVTLYGLSNCDTCRKARNWLQRFGIGHEFVDYRDKRTAPETLVAWRDALGGWDVMINRSSTTWRGLPEARRTPGSDAEWKLLLREHPALIRRPVV